MPYFRKLPSGSWQVTVRAPDGKRHTHTDKLKGVAKQWAADQEARYGRGDLRDPRAGEIRIGDWHDRVAASRGIDAITAAKNGSLWRTHCAPEWATWPMASVTRMEAQEWVNRLRATRRARHRGRAVTKPGADVPLLSAETVCAAVHLMSRLYSVAMKESPPLVGSNPFAGLELPEIKPRSVEFLEAAEADALYAAAAAIAPQWRTLIELGTRVGLRPGEIFGLHGHRVDWLRGQVQVVDVATRTGLRQWPKSRKSHRVVPVPAHILEAMSALMTGRARESLVFTAPEGGMIDDGNFRDRVWLVAVSNARLCGNPPPAASPPAKAGSCSPRACVNPTHGVRRSSPRIMRHTAASWLVQAGVPLYDVQALLGHESFATTQRYAHLAPDAHGAVLSAWAKILDAPVTHAANKKKGP